MWRHGTTCLCQRCQRPGVAVFGTVVAATQTWRAAGQVSEARDRQRHPLLLRTGCSWRMLPHDLPPWRTAFHYFRTWRRDGTWQRAHDTLHVMLRQAQGRQATPSAAIIDSQSVKTAEKGAQRVRRGQEGERAKTPHRSGYPGIAAGGGGASGRHSGSRRRPASTTTAGGSMPPATGDLGRRSLRRQTGGVGPGDRRLEPGISAPSRWTEDLSSIAQALGGGTDLRLAEPATAAEQRLRGIV